MEKNVEIFLKRETHSIQKALACYREIKCDKKTKTQTVHTNLHTKYDSVVKKLSSAATHSKQGEPARQQCGTS